MSRIEQALEKAARLRKETTSGESLRGGTAAADIAPPRLIPAAPPARAAREVTLSMSNELLVTASEPHSPAAEEYRKLKSLLVMLTRRDQVHNTLMVTSAIGGEGKSITAVNIAVSLAQEHDYTVLLVDADLRKPSVHHYLGFEAEIGLSDCLVEGRDISEALLRTNIEKLTILPGGCALSNPTELFSSQKMKNLMLEMKNRYPDRYIIFDMPPVLPFAETRTLGPLVDGVVFIAREGFVTLKEVQDGLASLSGSNILGVVYNHALVPPGAGRDSYYYRRYQGS